MKRLLIGFIIGFILGSLIVGAIASSDVGIERVFNDVWNSSLHTFRIKGVR